MTRFIAEPARPRVPVLLAAAVLFLFLGLAACQPEPAEVEDAALAEDTLAETEVPADDGEAAEVEVAEAGPAAWTCRRYLDVSDDTGALYDEELAAEAEDYVDTLFDAATAEDPPTLYRPQVPLRTAVRSACTEVGDDVLLTEAVRTSFQSPPSQP